jgi:prepilin-type N-terminal cleavage/methylation domain-containing protein/prepilin-type processing-associated H-X9-DG protein
MRRGLTLIEMIVVVAIIAALAALLLPAVQAAREASRRGACSSNLKQIALALHAYEAQHRSFPPGSSGSYGYLTLILPQIEQEAAYDQIQAYGQGSGLPPELRRHAIAVYKCPSDGISMQDGVTTNYAGNSGYDVMTKGANGIFHYVSGPAGPKNQFGRAPGIRFAEVLDGLSSTALVGELLVRERGVVGGRRLRANWAMALAYGPNQHDQLMRDCLGQKFQTLPSGEAVGFPNRGSCWCSGEAGNTLYTHCLTPNNLSCHNSTPFGAYTLASNHPHGVMLAYADGHVDFVAETIDLETWRALGTRDAGEAAR